MNSEESEKIIFIIIILSSFLCFILGWLNPIEGPFDWTYDKYASQPAHKHPQKYAPPQAVSIVIDVNDLSEEDFEALQEVFRNK